MAKLGFPVPSQKRDQALSFFQHLLAPRMRSHDQFGQGNLLRSVVTRGASVTHREQVREDYALPQTSGAIAGSSQLPRSHRRLGYSVLDVREAASLSGDRPGTSRPQVSQAPEEKL